MDDRTFDSDIADDWIKSIEKSSARDHDIYPMLKTWINSISPKKILDIGSGQGICSDKIDLEGRHYTGLEPSPFLVDRAKQLYNFENRIFSLGNVYHMPFADGIFDAAFSVLLWHLLSDLNQAAAELSRVLKTNAHFLIVTANPDAYPLWKEFYTDIKIDGRRLEGNMQREDKSVCHDVLYLHSYDEILSSLEANSLKVQKTESFRPSQKSIDKNYLISIQGQRVL